MTLNIAALLAKNDHTYYPLRFIASNFFVPYWKQFIHLSFGEEEINVIQNAARECVNRSMQGEDIYWNISFDEDTAKDVWELFDRLTEKLPDNTLLELQSLCIQLAASKDDIDSADYTLNLITRLRLDDEYREKVDFSEDDALLLNTAYEHISDELLDMIEIRDDWLNSDDPWDVRLRMQTPDLPESVWVVFTSAYEPRTNLPLIQKNIQLLLPNMDEYNAFIQRFKHTFEKSLSENMDIKFPLLLEK